MRIRVREPGELDKELDESLDWDGIWTRTNTRDKGQGKPTVNAHGTGCGHDGVR